MAARTPPTFLRSRPILSPPPIQPPIRRTPRLNFHLEFSLSLQHSMARSGNKHLNNFNHPTQYLILNYHLLLLFFASPFIDKKKRVFFVFGFFVFLGGLDFGEFALWTGDSCID
ncbi:hypothetical protein Droror1_Dr00011426 [Drosera rotundifolia]